MVDYDLPKIAAENPWWIDPNSIDQDNKLKEFHKAKFQWIPNLMYRILLNVDTVYSLRGPRQVGKTTLLKLLIRKLLKELQVTPESVFYWSFDRNSSEELHVILRTYLEWRKTKKDRNYLLLDEVCAVPKWSHELIHFLNKGDLVNCTVIVTGSHSMDLKHETERMPGRRGGDKNDPLDKILLPMKFSEFAFLLEPKLKQQMFDLKLISLDDKRAFMKRLFSGELPDELQRLAFHKQQLNSLFETYLITGGIPSVINEYVTTNALSAREYNKYVTAIIGDLNRFNFKERYVKQLLKVVFSTMTTPVSWNSFTKDSDISSHHTVSDYMTAFEDTYLAGTVFRCDIQHKTHHYMKKVYVLDPFMFHALHGWVHNKADYFVNAKTNIFDSVIRSKIVESIIYNHLCRFAYNLKPRDLYDPKDSVFYYRDQQEKEIDFVVCYDDIFYPFEVKFQNDINPEDYFGFRAFNKGILISKDHLNKKGNYITIPTAVFLMLI